MSKFLKAFNLKDWKVHALCLAMVLASELIGKFPVKLGALSFTLLPMLYALIIIQLQTNQSHLTTKNKSVSIQTA